MPTPGPEKRLRGCQMQRVTLLLEISTKFPMIEHGLRKNVQKKRTRDSSLALLDILRDARRGET